MPLAGILFFVEDISLVEFIYVVFPRMLGGIIVSRVCRALCLVILLPIVTVRQAFSLTASMLKYVDWQNARCFESDCRHKRCLKKIR